MNPSREEALFALVLEKPVEKRAAFLDVMCEGDAALRKRLEALLAAHEQPETLLATQVEDDRPTIKLDLADGPDEAVGQMLGRYKLLERVGEGGCGVVYVAEQTEPVRRRVALKVIKLGMDTKAVVARFEAERQALAMMDHPNIAKVLDAGSTEKGRPYFVMELVRGIRITDYCDQNNLPTQERLDLFIKVCQAIQHAHQKGIIHRDIKPSNILVTLHDGVPVPKVIDFGIAKATEGRLTDATVYTQLHQFIGTPAYMSPEQAEMSGLDIDTRSDIYSLGVLLYELLAGSTPFDAKELMASGIDAMVKTIREKEPVRPSTRLATLKGEALTTTAKRRSSEAPKLIHLLKGDLDWIVMKCLEKDRTRRYETANGLAADLKRHLNNEPVAARPPSTAYKFQKAFRRNKLAFTAAMVVLLALLIGIVGTSLGLVRAEKQRRAAEQARKEAEEIATFLGQIFQNPDPFHSEGSFTGSDVLSGEAESIPVERVVTAADMLNVAARKLETDLARQPEQRAKLQATMGRTYRGLGLYPQAIALHEKVRDYYVASRGSEHPDTLASVYDLAETYSDASRVSDAVKLLEGVLPMMRRRLGPEHPQVARTLTALGLYYGNARRVDEGIKTSEEAVALCRKVFGLEHRVTLRAMHALGYAYFKKGLSKEALTLREEVLPLRRKVLGPEHPETINAMENLANSYQADERLEEALRLREEVLALRRKAFGPEHPETIRAMDGLARLCNMQGRHDQALKLREEALAFTRTLHGPEHPATVLAMSFLGDAYRQAGRLDEAIELNEKVLPLMRNVRGPEDPQTIFSMTRLADSYELAGRVEEALKVKEEELPLRRKVFGPEHQRTLEPMRYLANMYMTYRKYAQAEPLLKDLLTHARKSTDTNSELESVLQDMAELRYRQKRYGEAEAFYRERIELGLREPGGETTETVLGARASLARLYSDWAWAERATNGAAAHERAIKGEKLLRETIAAREQDANEPSWRKADRQSRLGGALSVLAFIDPALTATAREPKLVEAEATLQRAQSQMENDATTETKYCRDGIERVMRLYEAWPKPDQLAAWKQKLAAFDEAEAKKNKPVQP